MMNFGDAIKKARIKRDLTQKELAEKLGVTITHVSYLENNRRNPSNEFMGKLCNELNVPKEALLWDALIPDDLPLSPDDLKIVFGAKKIVEAFYGGEADKHKTENCD